tara:strand:- start:137 stop:535 length:399 start_codon:yes stop_codon:yes gene_type:complete
MIQRIQSLFFAFSTISLLVIVYYYPIIKNLNTGEGYLLSQNFIIVRGFILMSATLSLIGIFMFNNRKRQRLISVFARLMITIAILLILFVYKKEDIIDLGSLLLIIPFSSLILANYFIRKDEKLIKSVDRIR